MLPRQPAPLSSKRPRFLSEPTKYDSAAAGACQSGAIVPLTNPVGTRKVVDDHQHAAIPVDWTPPVTAPPKLSGSVAQVQGKEGPATVTGWVVIDKGGHARLCDALANDATNCGSPTLDVDWSVAQGNPPSDLITRGSSRVSSGPLTLVGSLKDGTLFVGVLPPDRSVASADPACSPGERERNRRSVRISASDRNSRCRCRAVNTARRTHGLACAL